MLQLKYDDDKFEMLATDFGHHDPKGVTKISILSPILKNWTMKNFLVIMSPTSPDIYWGPVYSLVLYAA